MLQDQHQNSQSRNLAGLVVGGLIVSLGLTFFIAVIHAFLTTHQFDYNIYRVLDLELKEFPALLALVLGEVFFFLFFKNHFLQLVKFPSAYLKKVGWMVAAAIPAFVINQLTCTICEPFMFWLFLLALYASFGLVYWYRSSIFHTTLLIILIGASLNASLSFWLHEETNRGTHLRYASKLANPLDSLAEAAIADMILQKPPIVNEETPSSGLYAYWEKQWLTTPYLAANYEFGFGSCDTTGVQEFEMPQLISRPSENPLYTVYFKEAYCLEFSLKKEILESVYLPSIPYKNMARLKDYNYAVFYNSTIIRANSHDFDVGPKKEELPAIGSWKKVEREDYDAIIYRANEASYVLIGEPLSEMLIWVSNFTFQFSLFLLLIVVVVVLRWLAKGDPRQSWQKMPIQSRIQVTIFGMVFLIFLIISVGTIFFLNRNNQVYIKEVKIRNAEYLADELTEEIDRLNWDLSAVETSFLQEYSRRNLCDIDLYDDKGRLLVSSHASAANSLAPTRVDKLILAATLDNPKAILTGEDVKGKDYAIFSLAPNGNPVALVKTYFSERALGSAHDIPLIIGDFLNIYVFLLFFAWGVGLLLVSILTRPLNLLARKLRMFELGQANQKLQWEGNDTIGRLIQDYNNLVEKLDVNASELARAEREGAWKTMAQQIAHEINNPLTPLRLNIQYLTYAFSGRTEEEKERLESLVKGLLEQVDKLSKIASQFNVFARMETPELKQLNVVSFLEDFAKGYEIRGNTTLQLQLGVPHNTAIIVKADPSHLSDVLGHLIKNAEDAFPGDRTGKIEISLHIEEYIVRIEVKDNGVGIPKEVQSKLFEPSFSTKSSGSGLGLAVSRKIIEFFKGTMSFSTIEGEGTTFFISLPIYTKTTLE